MKSIKTKIFTIVLTGIIASSVIIGSFGVFWSSTAIRNESSQVLDLMAQVQTDGLNSMFSEVEQSSIVLSHYVSENLDDFSIFQNEDRFSRYIGKLEDIAFYLANCTNSALSVYVRFAPELTDEVASILWIRRKGVFEQDSLCDFPIYESDFDNSWYYRARKYGIGVWTKPYYNEDIKEYVVSYGIPVYKNGKFFAVVGMDIDFDSIVSVVNSISVYKTGYAFLTDEAFVVTYHRSIPSGTRIVEETSDFKQLNLGLANADFYEYIFKEKKFRMTYKNLVNGMRLVVSVPSSEIDSERTRLIFMTLAAVFLIVLVLSLITLWMSRRLTQPLKELANSTSHIIAGNYDVKFTSWRSLSKFSSNISILSSTTIL